MASLNALRTAFRTIPWIAVLISSTVSLSMRSSDGSVVVFVLARVRLTFGLASSLGSGLISSLGLDSTSSLCLDSTSPLTS